MFSRKGTGPSQAPEDPLKVQNPADTFGDDDFSDCNSARVVPLNKIHR